MSRAAQSALAVLLVAAAAGVWLVTRDNSAGHAVGSVARRAEPGDKSLPSFDGVAPTTRPPGEVRAVIEPSLDDEIPAGNTPAVPTTPQRKLSGRVVRACDGQPCLTCQLRIRSEADGVFVDAPSGPEGRFSFMAPESATEVTVSAVAPRHANPQNFKLPPGNVSDMLIVYDSGFVLRGRVLDGNGVPLPDAQVTVDDITGIVTDATGRFEVEDVAPSSGTNTVNCEAYAALHTRENVHLMVPTDHAVIPFIEIRLHGSGAIEGSVTDAAGEPLAGQPVKVMWEMTNDHGSSAASHLEATSDAPDGHYRIDGVPAGRYVVRAGSPELDDATRRADRVHVTLDRAWAGQPGRPVADEPAPPPAVSRLVTDVTVEDGRETHLDVALSRGATIAGRVTDSQGAPVADAAVKLRCVLRWPAPEQTGSTTTTDGNGLEIASRAGADGRVGETVLRDDEGSTTTNASGGYKLTAVPEGEKILAVFAPAAAALRPQTRTLNVQPEQRLEAVDFVLPVGLTLSGVVVDIAGTPIEGALVFAKEPGEHTFRDIDAIKTGDDGRFEITGLSPEADQLSIQKAGYAPLSATAVPGDAAQTWVLKHAPRVRGEVVDAVTGHPLEVLDVSVETGNSIWNTTDQPFAGGHFDVEVEDDETCTVRLSADGFVEEARTGVVPSLTETVPLKFRLARKP